MTDAEPYRTLAQEFYEDADSKREATVIPKEIEDLKPLLEIGNSRNFLDIGCYDGSKTVLLAENAQSTNIHGIDFLHARLAMAAALGIQTKWVDLNSGHPLPYDDSSFDFIYCGDVIEHIYSPDHLVKEIQRLIKPSGYALIRTPNLASWRNRVMLLLGYQPFMTEVSTEYRLGNPRMGDTKPSGHIRVFTMRAMRELVDKYELQLDVAKGIVVDAQIPNPDIVSRVSKYIDRVVENILPDLADEMIVKVRKNRS